MQYYTKTTDEKLAYMQHKRSAPHVVFLSGFKSDMTGSKAMAVDEYCAAQNLSYTRFDYRGHGSSDGEFLDGCISDWLDDTLDILNHVVCDPCIVIGSSMGGWLALLAALKRPEQIQALIGIAPAPDFTEKLMWEAFTKEQQQALTQQGYVDLPNCYDDGEPYRITQKLIEDGRKNLLMSPCSVSPRTWDAASQADGSLGLLTSPEQNDKSVDRRGDISKLNLPIRLLHGMADVDVPWQTSNQIAQQVASEDVEVHFIKNAGHRMSDPAQLELLTHTLSGLIQQSN